MLASNSINPIIAHPTRVTDSSSTIIDHVITNYFYSLCSILSALYSLNLRKVMIYLLTSCNTEERIAQNIYIHNSNRNIKKSTTRTILIKKRIGIGYKNYEKQCPGQSKVLGIAFHSSYNLCLSVS